MTREEVRKEAIKKGYLEDNVRVLKPVLKAGKMINDPKHIGYFMWEGAVLGWVLPQDTRGILANPFKNEDERKFFEEELNLDLNTNKRDNKFWTEQFSIRITKDSKLMGEGIEFNMLDPMDNLRAKVIMLQDEVAKSTEEKENNPHKKFIFINKDAEEKVSGKDMDNNIAIFSFLGVIRDSNKKMKEFLSAYLLSKKSIKEVSSDVSNDWLLKEIELIIKDDKKGVLDVINDPNYETKLFIIKAIKAGAIQKSGVNTFYVTGQVEKLTLLEMINTIDHLKEMSDDIYLRIVAQIEKDT